MSFRTGCCLSSCPYRLTISFILISETHEPSWSLSVDNTDSTAVQLSWDEFPHRDKHVENMFVRITEANKHVSMLLPVSKHERSRRIENLNPNRNYFIQVLAFMGPDFQDEIYSSINVSATTNEGGNVLTKDI